MTLFSSNMFSTRRWILLASGICNVLGDSLNREHVELGDISMLPRIDVPGHGWEVLEGVGQPTVKEFKAAGLKITHNGIDRLYDGYSRKSHIDGHTNCPLEKEWFQMWPPSSTSVDKNHPECFVDNMRAYQHGNSLDSPVGTEIRLGTCKSDYDDKYHGGYDWRYGGIRPQDNPDMALYEEIALYVEDIVDKNNGSKVAVRGYSGGTINSYAFLMSQPEEWRKAHVLAYIVVSPVFGGTVSSMNSILSGWARGDMTQCIGRAAALYVPSVLWMFPRPGETQWFWNRTEVLVATKTKNYTAYDLPQMLTDMGLPKVRQLLELEIDDYLNKFEPPMVDTYAFYGYGKSSQAGFTLKEDLSPKTHGEEICPQEKPGAFSRPWDDGDGVGSLRSTSRAGQWEDAHKKAGVVLQNRGYKGMGHSCSTTECKADYNCLLAKLQGKPHTGC